MDLLFLLTLIAIWLYTFWVSGKAVTGWFARRAEHKKLYPPKKRHLRPFRRSVANEQPKRRISYRPPNNDGWDEL